MNAAELDVLWSTLCEDPYTPDWFELTEHGEVVVKPRPTNRHQTTVSRVADQVRGQIGGVLIQRLAIMTNSAGVRCADAAWYPSWRALQDNVDSPTASCPELLIEVLAPADRPAETAYRLQAFLEAGAQEIVVVAPNGRVTYYSSASGSDESVHQLVLDTSFLLANFS
jgi:Uma2 family endonuclease